MFFVSNKEQVDLSSLDYYICVDFQQIFLWILIFFIVRVCISYIIFLFLNLNM